MSISQDEKMLLMLEQAGEHIASLLDEPNHDLLVSYLVSTIITSVANGMDINEFQSALNKAVDRVIRSGELEKIVRASINNSGIKKH